MMKAVYVMLALACLTCIPLSILPRVNAQSVTVLNSTGTTQLPATVQPRCTPCQQPQPIKNVTTTTTQNGREITIVIPPIHVIIPNSPSPPTTNVTTTPTSPSPKIIIIRVPTSTPAPCGGDPCGGQQQPPVQQQPPQQQEGGLVIHPDPFGGLGKFCSDGHRGELFQTSSGTLVTICPNNGASFIFHHSSASDNDEDHGSEYHHSNNAEDY